MRRLLWAGVGAVGAVLATERLRRAARRYTPAGVTEQVEAVGQRATTSLHAATARFQVARQQRERELIRTLLVTPEGGDPHAVFGRRRTADRATDPAGEDDVTAAAGDATDRPTITAGDARTLRRGASPRPSGRVDEDEPLYDF